MSFAERARSRPEFEYMGKDQTGHEVFRIGPNTTVKVEGNTIAVFQSGTLFFAGNDELAFRAVGALAACNIKKAAQE